MTTVIRFSGLLLVALTLRLQCAAATAGWVLRQDYNGSSILSVEGKPVTNATSVAAGEGFFLALRSDGTVIGSGQNARNQAVGYGACDSTNGIVLINGAVLSNVVAISAGQMFGLALKQDGTVVGWGETTVPGDVTNITSISAGAGHWLALTKTGKVLVGPKTALVPEGLTDVVAVAAGKGPHDWDTALLINGKVIQWDVTLHPGPPAISFSKVDNYGKEYFGVGFLLRDCQEVERLTDAIAISEGENFPLALRRDGTVFGWSFRDYDGVWRITDASGPVLSGANPLTDIASMSAGSHGLGLAVKRDATVVCWGFNPSHYLDPPKGLSNVVSISAGAGYWVAITTSTNGLSLERLLK